MAIFRRNRKEKLDLGTSMSQEQQYGLQTKPAVLLQTERAATQRPVSIPNSGLGQECLVHSNPHANSHSLNMLIFSSMIDLLSESSPELQAWGDVNLDMQQPIMTEGLKLCDIIAHSLDATEKRSRDSSRGASKASRKIWHGNCFSKVYLYANSRLPQSLPTMKLYLPTFPLLCLAAKYSEQVYWKPSNREKEMEVDASWNAGAKAVVVRTAPLDGVNLVVFAVRGTKTFMDWVANFSSAPTSPRGFLDNVDNHCHSGFLNTARKMIQPLAARLRQMIDDFPGRPYSLLITGHSAGGAVAALLYAHMSSTSKQAESELNNLAGCFKRIHCVTFGAPPISAVPLAKSEHPALRKSLFISFLNEGDPIARGHPSYLQSLISLYVTPAPRSSASHLSSSSSSKFRLMRCASKSKSFHTLNEDWNRRKAHKTSGPSPVAPLWPVPDLGLSNAGELVLLRGMESKELESKRRNHFQGKMVVAKMITDEILRKVIWGNPELHRMRLYLERIELLALHAVTGRESP